MFQVQPLTNLISL